MNILLKYRLSRPVFAFVTVLGLASSSFSSAAPTTGFEGCIYGFCNGGSNVGCTAAASSCSSTNISNSANLVALFQGTTYELAQVKAGNQINGGKGYLSMPNMIMGMIQKLVTAGTISTSSIGTTGVTSQFTMGSSTFTGHLVFSANPV